MCVPSRGNCVVATIKAVVMPTNQLCNWSSHLSEFHAIVTCFMNPLLIFKTVVQFISGVPDLIYDLDTPSSDFKFCTTLICTIREQQGSKIQSPTKI
eukprot:m.115456 g.115456  ORF g.115456 m.115456 type:complete len:97 (+) comp28424_c0_seq1:8739-9029(+)